MTSDDFTMWLQGFFEIRNSNEGLTPEQVRIIRDHLALVFNKVTPDYPGVPWDWSKTFPNTTPWIGDNPISVTNVCANGIDSRRLCSDVDSIIDAANKQQYCSLPEIEDCGCGKGYQKLFTPHTGITAKGLC